MTGILNIKTFSILDAIRKTHKIRDIQWVKESGLCHPPRISELRSMATGKRVVYDRAFNFEKFFALLDGLKKIVGEDTVRAGILESVENDFEKDFEKDEKLIMLISILPNDIANCPAGYWGPKKTAISFLKQLNKAEK
jgi:hypothetical protein